MNKAVLIFTILLFVFFFNSSSSFAVDYVISSNHTNQINLSDNDTLTVQSGVTVDTSAAEPVELENHTFSTSSTTITNSGSIIGTTKGIEADQSTNFSINNSGTVSVTDNTNSPGSAISLQQSRGTVSITNSGTLESERADTVKLHISFGTATINNTGSITSSKARTINFGQHANPGTIINSGTISGSADTLYIYSAGTDTSAGTITNSGTITATGGKCFEINNVNDVTITNTGTISATNDTIYNIGENSSNGSIIINKGTISSGLSNHDLVVTTSVGLQSLTNDQGGNDALKLEGYLPVNYIFLANSVTDYGKLAVDSQNGATTFSISADSVLSAATYTDVITGVSSSRFTAGTTGTVTASNGKFNWTLTETSSGSTNWNLVITNFDSDLPTLSSSIPADNATGVEINSNIILNFSETVDVESGNIILKKTTDNSTVETFDVTGNKVTGTGSSQITINPTSDLEYGIEYYILIDATAFDDEASNSYAGINSTTSLSFTSFFKDPFNDPTITSLVEHQSAQSKKIIEDSAKSVIDRIDLIRKMDSNMAIQGIDIAFNFQDQFSKEIVNLVSKEYLKRNTEVKDNKWALWTEGNISYGSVGEKATSYGKKISSDGLIIGIDKKLKNKNIIGFALSSVWQETEVGNNKAVMDTESYSFISYGSIKIDETSHFDTLLGIGEMDIDIARKVTGGENTGDRIGRQIYGSVAYSFKPNKLRKNKETIFKKTIYSRLDIGYTFLNDYTESGVTSQTIHYNNHYIKNGSLSLGVTLNKKYMIKNGSLTPMLRFEGGISKSNNSLTEAYYVTQPNQLYTFSPSNKLFYHTRFGLGIGAKMDNDWSYNMVYDRQDKTDSSFINNLYLNIRKEF